MRFIICLALLLMTVCHTAYAAEKLTDALPPVPAVWYEGGTLQKATVGEWRLATVENQLATAADFTASLSNVSDIGIVSAEDQVQIKKHATELKDCINLSIEEQSDIPQDRPVAQLVVMCTIMKKSATE